MDKETYIIVGLGNPGLKYAHTRHNAGFDVTALLERRWNAPLTKTRFGGLLTETDRRGVRVVLCRPQTFMNLSGECVQPLLNWYKCPPDHLLVIYDDIDLAPGRLRLRAKGSAGTHNGMRSIIGCLGTEAFPRLRVGTGKPEGEWSLMDWVLAHYRTPEEQAEMDAAFARAADCVEAWLDRGFDAAMRVANAPEPKPAAKETAKDAAKETEARKAEEGPAAAGTEQGTGTDENEKHG